MVLRHGLIVEGFRLIEQMFTEETKLWLRLSKLIAWTRFVQASRQKAVSEKESRTLDAPEQDQWGWTGLTQTQCR